MPLRIIHWQSQSLFEDILVYRRHLDSGMLQFHVSSARDGSTGNREAYKKHRIQQVEICVRQLRPSRAFMTRIYTCIDRGVFARIRPDRVRDDDGRVRDSMCVEESPAGVGRVVQFLELFGLWQRVCVLVRHNSQAA